MSILINEDDKKWIDAGKSDEDKKIRTAAITNLLEMNGLKYEAGIGKSYIPEKNYFIIVEDKSVSREVNQLYENALNFRALGGGVGGLAGTGVRWGVRGHIDIARETVVVGKILEEHDEAVANYSAFVSTRKQTFPFWFAQCNNVLGLAGAIFNREMHHWNAENTKPQQALLGALGQTEEIPEVEFRKLFYLSIHPVPLRAMEECRQRIVRGDLGGISDAVAQRCRSAPAGFGDIHAAAQGAVDLRAEQCYNEFGNKLKDNIDDLIHINNDIMADAGTYHAFAASYGLKKKILDKSNVKRAMICCTAYIIVHVKGSLIQSAALKKFRNTNARMIQKWVAAFEAIANKEGQTLSDLAAD